MIKEIRKLAKQDKKKASYVRILITRGHLTAYEKNGYLAYDTEEYKRYKENVHLGRPRTK